MDSELSETRRVETLNLGELLYSVEIGTRILIRKLEKLIKKCVNLNLTYYLTKFALMRSCSQNIYIKIYVRFIIVQFALRAAL